MNEELRRDLKIAMNIMYDIETNLLEKIKACRQRIGSLNDEYNRIKGGDPQKGVQSVAIFLIGFSVFGLFVGINDSPEIRKAGAPLTIGAFVIIAVLIVLNLIRIKTAQEHKKRKADKWWEVNAQSEIAELNREIDDNNYIISGLISGNPILSSLPKDMLSGLTVYQLSLIVEQGRAYTLGAAMDVWFSEQETRRYREDMMDNMERIQSNQRELQGELSKVNQQLSEISFMEEMHYWEHRK